VRRKERRERGFEVDESQPAQRSEQECLGVVQIPSCPSTFSCARSRRAFGSPLPRWQKVDQKHRKTNRVCRAVGHFVLDDTASPPQPRAVGARLRRFLGPLASLAVELLTRPQPHSNVARLDRRSRVAPRSVRTSAKNNEPSEEVANVVDVRPTERAPIVGLKIVLLGNRPRFEFVHRDAAITVGTRYLRHGTCMDGPNT